ncbi:MAG: S-layer homology domain-containing protein [Clostridiales bacterium]|nr:S-layer homology domain-containing protein [Clostridiales bacterium]
MKTTKQKRALSLLLAMAAALSLTVLPGHASRFRDVPDERMSMAADALSALGVVSGTGEGQFSPGGHLTRAQLCKMAVELMGMGEQAQAQAYRTIFTDMKNHWARGYVNLAATTEVPAESGTRLMLGLGNGMFGPDREVTYQEAATLILRILGYGEEANRAWPRSAIETAAQLGLAQGLGVENPSGPITRGQTALLFYNMLSAPTKEDGKPYAARLGDPVENAILLASDATVNGQSGWVVVATGEGTESYLAAGPVDQSLLGKRGRAVLDKQGHFVTLVPDESTCVTGPVQRKQGYYLYLNNQRYNLPEDTAVYVGSAQDGGMTTYKEYMASLRVGAMVTLYLDGQGKVVGLYRTEATAETGFLVMGSRKASYETFSSLTGSERNYTIRKNGASISMDAIKQYDVVTYDPVAKVLDVCDVRLTCVYENASPSAGFPSRITAAGGNQFDVMADASSAFSGRKLGDSITLLLTSSGRVAGLLPKDAGKVTCQALGVIVGDGFQLLGCDLTLEMSNSVQTGTAQDNILNARSEERGRLILEPAGTQISSQFNTVNMTLNKMRVSPGVQVYERTLNGLIPRSLAELPSNVDAIQYHKDSSDLVDLIILSSYSGNGLKYGRIDALSGYQIVQLPGTGAGSKPRWSLQTVQQLVFTGKDGTETYSTGSSHYRGGYGVVVEYDGTASVTYLQAITNVPSSAFYTRDGITYVRTSKGVYQVDEDVQCFNGAASYGGERALPTWVQWMVSKGGTWEGELPAWIPVGELWYPSDPSVTKFSSLGECRNFSDTVTVYIDTTGQQVRVVEAGT